MNAFGRFLLLLAGLAISIVTSVLVMQNGWGMEPKSWGWIIGVYLAGHLVSFAFLEASKSKDKP